MANRYFQAVLDDKIEKFRFAFQQSSKRIYYDENSKKLIHPGEFGMYREEICKEFLRCVIPHRLDIGSGFLINGNGEIGTQCDIVIFDKNGTPLIESDNKQRFFPVETISAIGEIKSDLTLADFKKALNKLARNKKIREGIEYPSSLHEGLVEFKPESIAFDHIYSFLICNKLNFKLDNIVDIIDSIYDPDIEDYQKHNLILSVHDGLILYYKTNKVYDVNSHHDHYPFKNNLKNNNRFLYSTDNPNAHFSIFGHYLFMGTTNTRLFYPDMSVYIDGSGGFYRDQKF